MEDKIENIMFHYFTNIVKETEPGVVHKCPYTVFYSVVSPFLSLMAIYLQEYSMNNATPTISSLPSMFPSGDYKMTVNITDDKGARIAFISLASAVISPNKDTFG